MQGRESTRDDDSNKATSQHLQVKASGKARNLHGLPKSKAEQRLQKHLIAASRKDVQHCDEISSVLVGQVPSLSIQIDSS